MQLAHSHACVHTDTRWQTLGQSPSLHSSQCIAIHCNLATARYKHSILGYNRVRQWAFCMRMAHTEMRQQKPGGDSCCRLSARPLLHTTAVHNLNPDKKNLRIRIKNKYIYNYKHRGSRSPMVTVVQLRSVQKNTNSNTNMITNTNTNDVANWAQCLCCILLSTVPTNKILGQTTFD